MKIIQGLKEFTAFIATTALSCGVSQFFGAIKLIVDTGLLFSHLTKVRKISKAIELITENSVNFQNIEMIDTICRRLKINKGKLTLDIVNRYLATCRRKTQAKTARLYRSLIADACALIPLIGAHLSWRIATDYKGKSFTPVFSRGVQHLLENAPKFSSKFLFCGRSKDENFMTRIPSYNSLKIPVKTSVRNRSIQAFYQQASVNPRKKIKAFAEDDGYYSTPFYSKPFYSENPTVVLFHHAGEGGETMYYIGEKYRQMGFNVLAVTIGGYRGSPDVTTSEKSMYHDIEAIKQFLKVQGVREVAWHGVSLGTGLAMHAAADANPEGLTTLFVVADQPYDSAAGVAYNLFGSLGEGVLRAGLPEGHAVEFLDDKKSFTDGLNNLKKAEKLKELNIPLICSEGTNDFLMGRNKVNGRYLDNFALDLLKTRYSEEEWNQFVISADCSHGFPIEAQRLYDLLYKQRLLPAKSLKFLDQANAVS